MAKICLCVATPMIVGVCSMQWFYGSVLSIADLKSVKGNGA